MGNDNPVIQATNSYDFEAVKLYIESHSAELAEIIEDVKSEIFVRPGKVA